MVSTVTTAPCLFNARTVDWRMDLLGPLTAPGRMRNRRLITCRPPRTESATVPLQADGLSLGHPTLTSM
jgi:hypothetical protein